MCGLCVLTLVSACGRRDARWGTADQGGAVYIKTALRAPVAGDLIINEILIAPQSEQFIELANVSGDAIDLSGVTILAAGTPRYAFPEGTTIFPGGVSVIFGSAAPLSLTDRGDVVCVAAPSGDPLFQLGYTSADVVAGVSLTNPRDMESIPSPATASSAYMRHDRVPGAHDSNSPGTSAEGLPLR